MMYDGVEIPDLTGKEQPLFDQWIKENKINDPFHPAQHYDYVSAFRSGIFRGKDSGHFPDTYKTPGHPTFSIESKYYKPDMAAGYWDQQGKYNRINSFFQIPSDILKRIAQ